MKHHARFLLLVGAPLWLGCCGLDGVAGAGAPAAVEAVAEARSASPPSRAINEQVGNEILDWNQALLAAIKAGNLSNPQTIRMAATVNVVMFDARQSIERTYTPILLVDQAPANADPGAAAVQAAYVSLKSFYPDQASSFDKQRSLSLAAFSDADPLRVQRGLAWGDAVAQQLLAWIAADGFSLSVAPFSGSGAAVGQWQSVTGESMSQANLAKTRPFVLKSNKQFQAAFPRPWASLSSSRYAADFNEVVRIGAKESALRTPDQTRVAYFFNGYATSDYIEAALQIARSRHTSASELSRLMALLTVAMHDTSVTVFRAKRDFATQPGEVTWRPIVAIAQADLDGNPQTRAVQDWTPLIKTPNHPEYPASHPASHGAGARVLQHFFGDQHSFELQPVFNAVFPAPSGVAVPARRYTRLSAMAKDGIDARTYGGMHFRSSSEASARVGALIADYVLKHAATARLDQSRRGG